MSTWQRGLWLILYLLTMASVVGTMFYLRERTLITFDTPAARADWQAWREAAAEQSAHGPVQRRVPKSPEPPALVLMRDNFTVILAGSVIFSSLLFASFMWAVRGVLGTRRARS